MTGKKTEEKQTVQKFKAPFSFTIFVIYHNLKMGAHCGPGCLFEADADFPLAAPLSRFSLAGPFPGLRATPEPGRKDGSWG